MLCRPVGTAEFSKEKSLYAGSKLMPPYGTGFTPAAATKIRPKSEMHLRDGRSLFWVRPILGGLVKQLKWVNQSKPTNVVHTPPVF